MTKYPVYALTVKVEGFDIMTDGIDPKGIMTDGIIEILTDVPFRQGLKVKVGDVLVKSEMRSKKRLRHLIQVTELFEQPKFLIQSMYDHDYCEVYRDFEMTFVDCHTRDFRDDPPMFVSWWLMSYTDAVADFIEKQNITFDEFREHFDDNMVLARLTQ